MKRPRPHKVDPRTWKCRATLGWFIVKRIDADGDPTLFAVYHVMQADAEIDDTSVGQLALTNNLPTAVDYIWNRMIDDLQLFET